MKTKTFCLLASLACGLALATDMVNLTTQSRTPPTSIGKTIGITPANGLPLLLSVGWRIVPTVPPVADGWTRSQVLFVEGDGTNAVAQYSDTSLAVIAAQQAAAASNAAIIAVSNAAVQAQIFTNTVLPMLQSYRNILDNYFGIGAETNLNITVQSVSMYFLTITNITPQISIDSARIMFLFNTLSPQYNGDMHNVNWSQIP